jgi:hypothetical protein
VCVFSAAVGGGGGAGATASGTGDGISVRVRFRGGGAVEAERASSGAVLLVRGDFGGIALLIPGPEFSSDVEQPSGAGRSRFSAATGCLEAMVKEVLR